MIGWVVMSTNKIKRKIIVSVIIAIILALLLCFLLQGDNLEIIKSVISGDIEKEGLQDKLHELGYRGYLTIAILSMLQVIFMVLPAEPTQVLAGLSFGVPTALACCLIGYVFGITAIFVAYKIYGDKMSSYFDQKLDIDVKSYSNSSKLTLVIFILYFLPAIPYGMISFISASLGMKYGRFLWVNTLGAVPSILIGVLLGHMAASTSWIFSLIVFVALITIMTIIMSKRDELMEKINNYINLLQTPIIY